MPKNLSEMESELPDVGKTSASIFRSSFVLTFLHLYCSAEMTSLWKTCSFENMSRAFLKVKYHFTSTSHLAAIFWEELLQKGFFFSFGVNKKKKIGE